MCRPGLDIAPVFLLTRRTSHIGLALFRRLRFFYCSFGLLCCSAQCSSSSGSVSCTSVRRSSTASTTRRSSFAIYMLHGAPFVALHVINPSATEHISPISDRSLLLGAVFLPTLGIFAECIAADNLPHPLWRRPDRLGQRLQRQ